MSKTKHSLFVLFAACCALACATDDGSSPADASLQDGSTAGDSGGDTGGGCPGYDLQSYVGSTDGLCPAADNTGCSCFELTQGGETECDPTGSGCVVVPANCVVCGWLYCAPTFTSECAAIYDESYVRDIEKNGPILSPCVSDAQCGPNALCTKRIGNRMFCNSL